MKYFKMNQKTNRINLPDDRNNDSKICAKTRVYVFLKF